MKIILVVLLVVFLLGCDSDDNSSSSDLFSVKVTDVAGEAVSGLQVIVNNACFKGNPFSGRAVTTISFCLDNEYYTKLNIYNIREEPVRNLIDQVLSEGIHSIVWDGKDDNDSEVNVGSTNIFRYELILLTQDSLEVVFQESRNMCMELAMNPAVSSIGSTDKNGEFTFNNKLAFPHLFNPETQEMYDEDFNYICEFTLIDSIDIKLHNPETDEYLIYTVLMDDSDFHHYQLIWDNPQSGYKNTRYVSFDYFEGFFYNSEEVILSWGTIMEYDLSGFNIYRRHTPGEDDFFQINSELIPAANFIEGAEYSYPDPDIMEDVEYYYYKLEAVNTDSTSTFSETIQIEINDPNIIIPDSQLMGNYPNPFN